MIPAMFAINTASQILSSLMSALDPSTATSSASSAPSSTAGNATFACGDDTDASSPDNSLTGSTQGKISGQILATLIAMQQQSSDTAGAAPASATQSQSPLDQLFSAMDTNGDGSVSQSEMESYIQNLGGTQSQADALFSALDQIGTGTTPASSTAGITENQMSSALQQAHSGGGMHRHHHHQSAGSSDPADQAANALLQAIDSNDDGAVSQDELTSFVTSNGGTAAQAQTDFAALDTNGATSLTSADFAKAWENWQGQQSSQSPGSMLVSLLNNFAQADSASAAGANSLVSA